MKLRFKPDQWRKGKSGAVRVLYAHFEPYGLALLVAAYAKSEQDDIPAAHRKAYAAVIRRIDHQLHNGGIK